MLFRDISITATLVTIILSGCTKPDSHIDTKDASFLRPSALAEMSLEQIYDEQVEFLPEQPFRDTRYPRKLVEWVPTGINEKFVSDPSCEASLLRDHVLSLPNEHQLNATAAFIKRCATAWRSNDTSLHSLIRFAGIQYPYENSHTVSYVKMRLQNGKIVRGLLGLKPDTRKRPFVIASCGIMCRAGDHTSQYMLMQLFDETPFNVLVLSNETTDEYYYDNGVGGLGGINGSDAIMRLARYFNNPKNPLYDRISSVHVFGISLGSHEALYATRLNTAHQNIFGIRPIKSFTGSCPVIDYSATAFTLFDGIKGRVFKHVIGPTIDLFASTLTLDQSAIDKDTRGNPIYSSYIKQVFIENQKVDQNKFAAYNEAWSIPPVATLAELVKASSLQNYFDEIHDPVLLWASNDDPIVSVQLNTQLASDILTPEQSNFIAPVIVPEGAHCAVPIAYGWRNASMVFQTHILANAPEFTPQLHRYDVPFLETLLPSVAAALKKSKIYQLEWSIKPNSKFANLRISLQLHTLDLLIPLSAFPEFVQNASNDVEAQANTRWMNVQVRLLDKNGNDIIETHNLPSHFEYVEL